MENNNFMKKLFFGLLPLCFLATAAFAAPLRNYVCIVRSNLPKDTVTFLEEYRDRLSNRGYASYAKDIDAYLKGSFGSGFVLYASNGKPYVVTNRHVVKEAETVDVEFENEDGSNSNYKERNSIHGAIRSWKIVGFECKHFYRSGIYKWKTKTKTNR